MDKFKAMMLAFLVCLGLILVARATAKANEQQQTTFYDARGNVVGHAARNGEGTTKFYDARGNVVGSASKPRR